MKPGNRIYKGIEVPLNAKIHLSDLGREYYLSGIIENNAAIRFIDNGDIMNIPLNKAKMIKLY